MECGGGGLATANPSSLDDLFSTQTTEVDVGIEWLSIFVEDCFSNRGDCCLPAPTTTTSQPDNTSSKKPPLFKPHNNLSSASTSLFPQFAVAGKARSKRKRIAAAEGSRRASLSGWSVTPLFPTSDPPLLDQAYWMADSELIAPKGGSHSRQEKEKQKKQKMKVGMSEGARRCSHCLSQRTPQWRAGPMGPKTLCNACGVRYKSGRLLPEYRPAKSPTFMSCLHSNSHKKVLEMRNHWSGIGIGTGTGTGGGTGGECDRLVEYSSSVPTAAAADNRC